VWRYASRKYWDELSKDLPRSTPRPAPTPLRRPWTPWMTSGASGTPRSSGSGANAWSEFIPFLEYVEIRKVICSTNAIESLNARYRRAVKARGHFPAEQAAMKCLYLVTRSLGPKGTGQTRWAVRWKPALNALAITFADRMPKPRTDNNEHAIYTVCRTLPRSRLLVAFSWTLSGRRAEHVGHCSRSRLSSHSPILAGRNYC
jgi:transposase-like protein